MEKYNKALMRVIHDWANDKITDETAAKYVGIITLAMKKTLQEAH